MLEMMDGIKLTTIKSGAAGSNIPSPVSFEIKQRQLNLYAVSCSMIPDERYRWLIYEVVVGRNRR